MTPPHVPRALAVGGELRLVVLAPGSEECVAVDQASGAFVWVELGGARLPRLERYDVVAAQLSLDDDIPDPARPEAAHLEQSPVPVARFRGRRARRFLRSLVTPPGQTLLGFPGPSTTYWSLTGTDPSLALVKPDRPPQLMVRADGSVRTRFPWGGLERQLAVSDPALVACIEASRLAGLPGAEVVEALGFRPAYLLIALTSPVDGHCYKTVAAALPDP